MFIFQGDAVPLTPAKGRYTPFGIPIQIHRNPHFGDYGEFGRQAEDIPFNRNQEISPLDI
jgi:hypothetical protein